MKRWIGCEMAVVLCVLGTVGCNHAQSKGDSSPAPSEVSLLKPKGPPPKLVVDENTYNFGIMDQLKTGSHVFEVRNEGPGELVMRFANTTCGCTSVKLGDVVWGNPKDDRAPTDPVSAPPGGTIPVELSWATELRGGDFRTTAKIETSDPEQPVLELSVTGEIVPFIEMTERQVHFTEARASQPSVSIVYVYSRKLDDLQITRVDSSNPLVGVEFEPAPESYLESKEAKSGLKGVVTLQPGLPIGPLNANLKLHTNYEDRPTLDMNVTAQVVGDVILTPEDRIDFKLVKVREGHKVIRYVKIISESDVRVTVGKVEPEFLKVTIQQSESGKNRYKLTAEVPANLPPSIAEFRGAIELETDHPTAKVVKIPVRGQLTLGRVSGSQD